MAKFWAIAGMFAMIAVPAGAQTAATSQQAQEVSTSDSSDARRIVCKREETVGSRLAAKKVCLTVQQWEENAKAHRDTTESWQRQAPTRSGS